MKLAPDLIVIIVLSFVVVIESLWIRDIIEDEEDEVIMTLEDPLGNWGSNSRGPRSLYRGLEVETDFLLDYAESSYDDYEDDFDFL